MNPRGILESIVAARKVRLAELKAAVPLAELQALAVPARTAGRFRRALVPAAGAPLRVIAELKRASPSAGCIREDFEPQVLAAELAAAGAAALSILTEPDFFAGDDRFLCEAQVGAPELPLLRKDFLIDAWQVWESRRLGADAVLLIVALFSDAELAAMLAAVSAAGLEALVEVKDGDELRRAQDNGAAIVGVNARNLDDFGVDLARSERLASRISPGVVGVAESGVTTAADLVRLCAAGFDAALVGTELMRAARPGEMLASWLHTAGQEAARQGRVT